MLIVTHVPSKESTIKCSSMKSNVFPFILNSSFGELMVFSLLTTQIMAKYMNNNPGTAAVAPCR